MSAKINLMSREITGKTYGIGRCSVTIGGAMLDSIAVVADGERHISDADGVIEWLVARGMTKRQATDFGLNGLKAWDEAYAVGIAN